MKSEEEEEEVYSDTRHGTDRLTSSHTVNGKCFLSTESMSNILKYFH